MKQNKTEFLWNIEQQTDEWLQAKWGRVGGTSAAQLLKYQVECDLFFEMLSQWNEPEPEFFEQGFINDAMMRGIELEPMAIEAVSKKYSIDFDKIGYVKSDIPTIGISPDALTMDASIAVEAKCLSGKEHMKIVASGEVPLKHVPQCCHYFAVIPCLKTLYFAAYRPENKYSLAVVELTKDSLVNVGTEAKPKLKTIDEASGIIRSNAEVLYNEIINFKIK